MASSKRHSTRSVVGCSIDEVEHPNARGPRAVPQRVTARAGGPNALLVRHCAKCGPKPLSDFARHGKGWQRYCRDCHRAYYQTWDQRRKRALLGQRESPTLRWARHLVRTAIRSGVLAKGLCCEADETCSRRIDGHHDDYAMPLEVRWLCRSHHIRHHRDHGPGAHHDLTARERRRIEQELCLQRRAS